MLNQTQKKLVLKKWSEIASEIEDVFGLTAQATPSKAFATSKESVKDDQTPGFLEQDAIIFNSRIRRYEDLLLITTTKLCFQSALPTDLLCCECIDDLSFEYARRKIKDDALREHWERLWSVHSPPRQVSSVIHYDPSSAYVWLHSVAGERGLDTIVRELTHRAKHQIPLTFDDYLQYFSTRIHRFENTLDETELKIVRHIVETPGIQFNSLAKLVGITPEWLTRKISQLQKRTILRMFERVPFSRVGILMLQLLMTAKSHTADSFSLIKDCPFLYSFGRVTSGEWDSLATLCVPDNKLSVQYLDEGLGIIQKMGVDLQIHRIKSSGVSYCFDYYSPKDKQWSLPWELLSIHLQRIMSDNLSKSIPRVDTPELKLDIPLDDLDVQVLDCINNGISSVSKIRKQLKVGQHRVAASLQKLRDNRLSIKTWEAHNIGLSEHVVVHAEEKDLAEAIAAWSLRLPRSIISFSTNDELMLIADLPLGGSYGLASAIGGIDPRNCIGILSPSLYRGWSFPVSLWESNYQKWMCPEERIRYWIDSLH